MRHLGPVRNLGIVVLAATFLILALACGESGTSPDGNGLPTTATDQDCRKAFDEAMDLSTSMMFQEDEVGRAGRLSDVTEWLDEHCILDDRGYVRSR